MAAGNTYIALATNTLSSSAASVTFSSISGAYTDLVLICNAIGVGQANFTLQFNGDTASNYSSTVLSGDGTTATSFRYTTATALKCFNSGQALNVRWGTFIANIQNYTNTTTSKSVLMRFGSGGYEVDVGAGLWFATSAAITSVTIASTGNNYDTGSTFQLFGIAAA